MLIDTFFVAKKGICAEEFSLAMFLLHPRKAKRACQQVCVSLPHPNLYLCSWKLLLWGSWLCLFRRLFHRCPFLCCFACRFLQLLHEPFRIFFQLHFLPRGSGCSCDVDQWQVSGSGPMLSDFHHFEFLCSLYWVGYCCSLSPGDDCPSGCSLETAQKVGSGTSGGFVCEADCTEAPEGAGAESEDLHIFVTIKDSTASCLDQKHVFIHSFGLVLRGQFRYIKHPFAENERIRMVSREFWL